MTLEPPFDRIAVEADKMGGQPCIRALRITVKRVREILCSYPEREELFADYPDLEEADLQQALSFSAAISKAGSRSWTGSRRYSYR